MGSKKRVLYYDKNNKTDCLAFETKTKHVDTDGVEFTTYTIHKQYVLRDSKGKNCGEGQFFDQYIQRENKEDIPFFKNLFRLTFKNRPDEYYSAENIRMQPIPDVKLLNLKCYIGDCSFNRLRWDYTKSIRKLIFYKE